MPESTREEKLKIFSKLPSDLQEVIFAESTADIIDALAKEYGLPDEKTTLLATIIGDIFLGLIRFNEFVFEIRSQLGLTESVATNVASDVTKEIFSKVATSLQVIQPGFALPAAPAIPTPTSIPVPVAPTTDRYREPAATLSPVRSFSEGGPEVIDLRKTPPPPMPMPVAAAPIPPIPATPMPPIAPRPTPLTFTRPIEPINPVPLIEAEPHRAPSPVPAPAQPITLPSPLPKPAVPAPAPVSGTDRYREIAEPPAPPAPALDIRPSFPSAPRPQYIIRPPGTPPTDLPTGILDLRRDKGEF